MSTPSKPIQATRALAPSKRPSVGKTTGRTSQPGRHSASVAYATWDLPTAAARVEEGIPAEILTDVQERLGLDQRGLARVLGVSTSTLGRRKPGERLSPSVSERALRVARLAEIAARVLGGPDEARDWMNESNPALGDAAPVETARTEPGARLVERLLGEIEYGLPL